MSPTPGETLGPPHTQSGVRVETWAKGPSDNPSEPVKFRRLFFWSSVLSNIFSKRPPLWILPICPFFILTHPSRKSVVTSRPWTLSSLPSFLTHPSRVLTSHQKSHRTGPTTLQGLWRVSNGQPSQKVLTLQVSNRLTSGPCVPELRGYERRPIKEFPLDSVWRCRRCPLIKELYS